jgi:hypothetical protein
MEETFQELNERAQQQKNSSEIRQDLFVLQQFVVKQART